MINVIEFADVASIFLCLSFLVFCYVVLKIGCKDEGVF